MVVEHDHAFVAKMDDPAVAGDEPVLDAQGLMRLVRVRVGCEDALAVVRMEQPREQLGVGRPFLDAVTEHRLDLAACEDVRADRVELVEVDDERQLLDQRAIAAADLVRGQRRRRHARGKEAEPQTQTGNRSGWRLRLPRTGYERRPIGARRGAGPEISSTIYGPVGFVSGAQIHSS